MPNTREIQDWLIIRIAELLHKDAAAIDTRELFSNYGLSSIDAVTLSGELEEFTGLRLSPTITFDYPNIITLSNYLSENTEPQTSSSIKNILAERSDEPIAVIGMSCRFPGADNPEAFWQLLRDGVDMIREVPADRWNKQAFYHPDASMPGKAISYWGGFLENVDQFDPFFFGISPIEAKHMDPQQRLLLELSYEAFDDAAQIKEILDGSDTGVFVGISINEYSQIQLNNPTQIISHSATGSALSIAANRISYFYNFHGPSMAVDTACSSSLTAVHLACKSLRNDECAMAIAGGVNIILSPAHSIAFTKAGVLAPDGRCKTFDAAANGYVRGEGGGMIVLKKLSAALADGDTIHALILGSVIKQDGRTNGLMAPSSEGQEALLREAYKAAGVSPANVQYVEAHGTGTLLGDSMEAQALGNVIGANRKNSSCFIGSVKTSIGHLEAAAGIAGLIKVILSIRHKTLPASLHYHTPNPHISFDKLNLTVNDELKPWFAGSTPMLAGISSFGFGGTNVHVIISEAENIKQNNENNEHINVNNHKAYLLPLSSNDHETLKFTGADYLKLLSSESSVEVYDLCYATALRRSQNDHRLAIIGNSKNELYESLHAFLHNEDCPNIFVSNEVHHRQPKLVFIFSGQGGQWYGMGRELLKTEPVFRNTIEKTDELIQKNFSWSLIDELTADQPASRLNEIDIVQPAIFAIQVALAALWKSWGINPDAVAGHSMGEVAAAYFAGAVSLEDAVHIVCSRSELLKKLSGKGSMILAELTPEQAKEIVRQYGNDISVAAINSPTSVVLSGNSTALNEVINLLQQQNLFCKQVNVDVASHSSQIDLLRTEMFEALTEIKPLPANLPIYSTVTGALANDISFDANYWIENLRKPVLFYNTINQLFNDGYTTFIEIGPHPVLLGSVQQSVKPHFKNINLLASLRREEPEQETMFKAVASLYTNGFTINWKNFYKEKGKHVQLPAIRWQRQRYWLDINSAATKNELQYAQTGEHNYHPLLGQRISIANAQSNFIWQIILNTETLFFLEDHRVNNEVIFPAAGYIEMALQAAKETGLNTSHKLSDFAFKERMILQNENQKIVQTLITPDKENNYLLSIYSRSDKNENWVLHALASFTKEDSNNLSSVTNSVDDIREQGNSNFSADEFYQKLKTRGIDYGKSFRTVKQVWNKVGEALGEVELPGTLKYNNSYQIHPALLDGCLQVIAATQINSPEHDLYLPTGCKCIRFFSKPEGNLLSHVTLRADSLQQDIISADIVISDINKNIIAEIVGFNLQRSHKQNRTLHSQKDIWMYKLQWQVKEDSRDKTINIQKRKHWLIFEDDSNISKELAKQFEANDDYCHFISYKKLKGLAGEIEELINKISSPLYGIIYLCDAATDVSDTAIEMSMQNCNNVLYLIQALQKRFTAMPRLWLVTKGAQPVNNDELIAIEQSPIWGLGKTISFEIPELRCICVDLDPSQTDARNAELLFKQILKDDKEDQVAFRKNLLYVQRLFPFIPATLLSATDFSLRTNSTYLITGGMGGLGLKTAEWMVRRGAKHLMLIGRNKPSDLAVDAIDKMQKQGVEIIVECADVSDAIQLQKIFDKIKNEMPPLRGVIHAAGVLDDGSLLNLNAERMKKVMAPKVTGTLNLHNLTKNLPLDFFVLFSSAVSVLGSPGQGNYAAASAYLDAMAHMRSIMQLPAISISWGPWAEVGLAAQTTERLKEQNIAPQSLIKVIKIERGLEILEQLIKESTPQVMVLPFDLKNLIELYPTAAGMPFLSEVGGSESHVSRLYARPKLRQQYVAPRNELEKKLTELWRQTLHIDNVGVHDSFFELGGDSVLAAQILALAQKTFGIRINAQDAFKAFTIEKLAEMLEAEIMNKIQQMSEEEVVEKLSK